MFIAPDILKGIVINKIQGISPTIIAIACVFTLFCAPVFATHTPGEEDVDTARPIAGPSFDAWLTAFRTEAKLKGISDNTLDLAFKGVEPISRVIELDRNQPETKLTFDEYLARVVNSTKIEKGREKLKQNKEMLDKIYQKFGVQPRFIVALWGIETDFGRLTGGFRVIDALATLAFDGRRSSYFRGELLNALTIIEQGHISADDMKGSWAGAMGQTQFMPSTFLGFATDFTGDGKKDLWNESADALASGANYLSKSGWDGKMTWGREVRLPKDFSPGLIGADAVKTIAEWQALGVTRVNGRKLPGRDSKGYIVQLDGEKHRAFLVYNNYKAIMKWNRSDNFATTVGILADSIGGK